MNSTRSTSGSAEPLPCDPKSIEDCRHYFSETMIQNPSSNGHIDPLSPSSTKFGERVIVTECATSGTTYYNGNSSTSERKPKKLYDLLSCISNGGFLQMFSTSEEQAPCPCATNIYIKIDNVVDEWLHDVPIYASVNFDKLKQLTETLKNDLQDHSDNDDRIRKDIHKFLGNIPLFVPPEIKDRQQVKEPLIEKLLEALKSKIRVKDKFSEIIQTWVYSLPTNDEEVDRNKYAQCLNKCLRGVIANTNPYERKAAIRNFAVCELSKMTLIVDPSQQLKIKSELAERLADALTMCKLTPNIQKWISGISLKSKPPIDKERLALDFSDKIRKTIATHEHAQRTVALKNLIQEELSDLPIETEPGVDKKDYINGSIDKLLNILMLDELGKTIHTWMDNIPFAPGIVVDKDKLASNLAMKLRDEINGSKKIENLKEITRQELYTWPLYVPDTRKDEFLNIYAKQLVSKIKDAGELIDLNGDQKEALEYLKKQPDFAYKTTGEIKRMIKEAKLKPSANQTWDQKLEYFVDLRDELIADHDLWIETMDEDEKQALYFLRKRDGRFNNLSIGEKKRACKELAQKLRELKIKDLPDDKIQKKMEEAANKWMNDSKEIVESLDDEEKETLKYLQMWPAYADLNADDVKKTSKRLGNRLKNMKANELDPSEIERKMKNAADDLLINLTRSEELSEDQLQILKILKTREEYPNMGDGEVMRAVKEIDAKSKNLREEGLSDVALMTRLNKEISKWIDVSQKETNSLSEEEKEGLKYLKARPEYENVTYSEIRQGAKQLAGKMKKLKDQDIVDQEFDEEMEIAVDKWFDDKKDRFDDFDDTEIEIFKKLRQRPEYAEMGRGEAKKIVQEICEVVKGLEEQNIKGEELNRETEIEIDYYLNNAKQEIEDLCDDEKKALSALKDKREYANLTKEEIDEVVHITSLVCNELRQENATEEELEKQLDDEIEYWLSVKGPIKTTSDNDKTALQIILNSSETADLSNEEVMRAMNQLGIKVKELQGKGLTGKKMQDKLKEMTSDWVDERNAMMDSLKEDEYKAIDFLKQRPIYKTLTTDQLKDAATKLAEKFSKSRRESLDDNIKMQTKANKLLRYLFMSEKLDDYEKKSLEFIKKTKDFKNLAPAEVKKAAKQLGEIYKKNKQEDVSDPRLNEIMESETADVMLKFRQERIEKLNDIDDDEKRVLEILKKQPDFIYLPLEDMKETINKLSKKMKDLKSEGLPKTEIDKKLHEEASKIFTNEEKDLNILDEAELQPLEYLMKGHEEGYEDLTNGELRRRASELGSKLKEVKKERSPQHEFDEIMHIETANWLAKPGEELETYDKLNDDEKVVLLALKDSHEYKNMTKDMIRDGVKVLGQKRKEFIEQGKSDHDLDTSMSLEMQNFLNNVEMAPQNEKENRALALLQNTPGFADMTEDEKTDATQYLAEQIAYLDKQNLNDREYNKQEQEALKSALLQNITVNISELHEQTKAQSELSREESRQVFKYMLDNLWKMRKERKSQDDIEINMMIIIKENLESVFKERGQSVEKSSIEHLTDLYFDHFFKEIVDSPGRKDSGGLSADINVLSKRNSKSSIYGDKSKKKRDRSSFRSKPERLLSCMLSFSSISSISTGPASELNLLRAFVNDIRKWMEDMPEIASKTYSQKRKNKKFAKSLAKKLYDIETWGTSDSEVYKEMKNKIEQSLSKILPSANSKTNRTLSEKLLQILMETIDRVESSTSTTTSEVSLNSLS